MSAESATKFLFRFRATTNFRQLVSRSKFSDFNDGAGSAANGIIESAYTANNSRENLFMVAPTDNP